MLASKLAKRDTFKAYIKYIYEQFPESAKMIINSLTGDFGKKYIKKKESEQEA